MGCWGFGDGTSGENPDEERGSDFFSLKSPDCRRGRKGLHPYGRYIKKMKKSRPLRCPRTNGSHGPQLSSDQEGSTASHQRPSGSWKLGVEAVAVVMGSTEPLAKVSASHLWVDVCDVAIWISPCKRHGM